MKMRLGAAVNGCGVGEQNLTIPLATRAGCVLGACGGAAQAFAVERAANADIGIYSYGGDGSELSRFVCRVAELQMKRRAFISLLGLPAAWPLIADAQQPPLRTIGLLSGGSAQAFGPLGASLRAGMEAHGFVDGINVMFEARWANGHFDRLPNLAADLVSRNPAVIATVTLPAALAAKAATGSIPIVFVVGDDPVASGLVTNLTRSSANLTGMTNFTTTLGTGRLELVSHFLAPTAAVALLVNWDNPNAEREARDFRTAAEGFKRPLHVLTARTDSGIEAAFASVADQKVGALFVTFDSVFFARREQIIALAARYRLPTIYPLREFVVEGGLMSYGASFLDVWRQAGVYVVRILNGEKPGELPVQHPQKFELVINRNAATAIGFEVPPELRIRVDEVIG